MGKLWQLSQGHPKPAFSEKVQRGDQGKFFKNLPKSRPRLKGLKAHLRKWHYPLISMHLKSNNWKRFWSKKAAPKVPERPSSGTFRKVTQNPLFLKKCKGGTKKIFQKSLKKEPSFERPKNTLAQMALSFNLNALKLQRLEKILAKTAAPKVHEQPSYGNFGKVTRNPHFLKEYKGGTKGHFSNIA